MKTTAIVTGATGGIGMKFVEILSTYEDMDEIWAVARNKDKLASMQSTYKNIVPVVADLSTDGVDVITKKLQETKANVTLLVNNAGTAYMGRIEKMESAEVENLVKLNCSAPAMLVTATLPYMEKGARILNISSASSFQPNPYLCMYSASKVFLKNYSRALGFEMKERGITVTTVCPGWVDTGMLPREKDGKPIKYPGMISPDKVVNKALKDSKKGKAMSVPSFFAKYTHFYSKIMPARFVMNQWARIVKKYL
ncbi:MAG: SDR family NAD(P)-dependent oxidoreductase [Eubacterium sp.]|nr:SDR family NAD(P)-dependent oxidoreductase [Eubacterium sp.]